VKKLGICSAGLTEENMASGNTGYEISCLIREATGIYDEVILIDPSKVLHGFEKDEKKPRIEYQSGDISVLNSIIFRSIAGYEGPISLLARNLHYCGCDIIDPLERFSGAPSGKLFDSMKGFVRNILPSSYIVFDYESAVESLNHMQANNMLPLIIKPAKGKRGENVFLAYTADEALEYFKKNYKNGNHLTTGLIIQQFIEISDEYRGIVLGGKCLGIVRKIAAEGKIVRNAAQGGKFVLADDPDIVHFIEKCASKKGLVGLDVARDINGRMYYIESNRSPQWNHFEEVTGINVARALVEFAFQRTFHPSDLY